VCAEQGQTCNDPSIVTLSDWTCACPSGYGVATQVGGPAACVKNECDITANNDVCRQADQTCVDPHNTTVGDWRCQCKAPLQGSAEGGSAECSLHSVDECKQDGIAATCQGGQVCVDRDQTSPNTYECIDPNSGAGSEGDDKDDGCWWCWLLIVLGICCCCCLILAVLIIRKRNQADTDEWQQEAENGGDEELAEDRDEYKKSFGDENQSTKSLLYDEAGDEKEVSSAGGSDSAEV